MKVTASTTLTVAPRGEDAVIYGIIPSQSAVSIKWLNGQKVPSVDTLTFRPTKTAGKDTPVSLTTPAALAAEGLALYADLHGDGALYNIDPLQNVNVDTFASYISVYLCQIGDTENPICSVTVPYNLDGKDGQDGQDGTSITIVSTSVKYATSATMGRPDDERFKTAFPELVGQGTYLWSRTEVIYSDGNSTITYNVSRIGEDGGTAVPVPGPKGDYTFLHLAYARDVVFATTADGTRTPTSVAGFSTTPFAGARYIGIYSHTLDGSASAEDVDAAKQDPGADQFALYEWSLYVGNDGADAVNIIVSPQTVFLKKGESANSKHRIYVDVFKGLEQVPYANVETAVGFKCALVNPSLYLDEGHNVALLPGFDTTSDILRFYFIVFRTTGGAQADFDIEVPFTITFDGHVYNSSFIVKSIADGTDGDKGARGPILRGPRMWADCPVENPQTHFMAGADDEPYVDVVFHNNSFYVCQTSHDKTADNYPGSNVSDNGSLWQLFSDIPFLATKILLAQYSLIKNLGAEAIEMKDTAGKVVFYAKGGELYCKVGLFEGVTVTGTVNAESGKIAGFNISGNGLTNGPEFDNDAYILFRNDAHGAFAGIGGNILPATSGLRALARFENHDSADQWGIGRNIAAILSASNGDYNHAFVGDGNGNLDGWIGGYKFSKFTILKANTIYSQALGPRYNNKWLVYAPSNVSGSGVVLPTLDEVRKALGIGTGKSFCIQFTILADIDSHEFYVYGRNSLKDSSNAQPWESDQIPVLTHWNNGRDDRIALGPGDSMTLLLVYDPAKTGSFNGFSLNYTARRINHQN